MQSGPDDDGQAALGFAALGQVMLCVFKEVCEVVFVTSQQVEQFEPLLRGES